MKLPWKSGEITDKDAMWSTEINYGDGNGDGHGEGWSKIVKDGKRQWELVFTAYTYIFPQISAGGAYSLSNLWWEGAYLTSSKEMNEILVFLENEHRLPKSTTFTW